MHVAIAVFDGVDALDALGPYEVFGHARQHGTELTVGLCTHKRRETITTSHGLTVVPDGVLEPDEPPALLVVPGGGWTDGAETGVRAQTAGALPAAVAACHETGTVVASVCTGAMVLAAAGLTDGRPAATHHGAHTDLAEAGAVVQDARVVDDGDVVTAGGITAGIDLALHLLERTVGAGVAATVATTMEYERRGPVQTQ
ncbi:MAG: putative transcriptional regulator [halophilic archaeon J07HX5]|jgi:Transcriptional regulator containing an amidase domain and an AraC-type DNA-binding HTH domain|nr:MAG: putative transcriptional regulator [halophilic archaeon J07HX5]